VKKGDRVLLYMQNSPQFVLAYYGILRANAVVVPVNPMNMTTELRHYVKPMPAPGWPSWRRTCWPQMQPLLDEGAATGDGSEGLQRIVAITYSDHLTAATDLTVPPFIAAPRNLPQRPDVTAWADAMAAGHQPDPYRAGPNDLAVMPYTSGTTGHPKGCMHTHRTVMSTRCGRLQWFGIARRTAVALSVLPFFHVTGMQAQHERAAAIRRHRGAAAALGPRRRGAVHRALPASPRGPRSRPW
jgi:fatty-acyl-CoA synthase